MSNAVPALTLDTLDEPRDTAILAVAGPTPAPPASTFLTDLPDGMGQFWFGAIHVLPRRLDLGNIVATLNRTIDIYNAFVDEPKDLQAVINNAGAGTSFTDLPSLPHTIPSQRSLLVTLEVTADGAPTINATIDFDTEEPYLISVPITGTRLVMFPFEPEAPLRERLRFLTDVIEHKVGTEQRVSLRESPRQEFDFRLLREDGPERQKLDMLLFDWLGKVFGVPVWIEPSFLTAAATAGQTSISVDDTTLADFRAGGLAIIYADEDDFDALEVSSLGSTTINFNTPLLRNFPVGTRVMPLRTAVVASTVRERKHAVNLAEFELTMQVLDNIDLSDASAWPTFSGKVILSDPNAIQQTADGDIDRRIVVLDSQTGKFGQVSPWDRARHGTPKTFITTSRQGLWNVRSLLHALRGQQVSFYLPTFSKDVNLSQTYLSGGSALTIFNVGYTRFVRQRAPKVNIRIHLTNGTTFDRTVTNSAEVDETEEQLTISSPIGQDIAPEDVNRIEFIEKVRIATDDIIIEHANANGTARIGFPARVVLD